MCRLVYFCKIKFGSSKIYGVHAAPDVHADDVRHCLVADGHRCSDRTSFSRMHIRHNADPRAFRHRIIAHAADLLDGFLLYDPGIADGCIYFSFDFDLIHSGFLPSQFVLI